MIRLKTLLALLIAIVLVSCENDSYATGDGYLSDVTTAFGEAHYDAQGYAFKFVTDDDKTLMFDSAYGKPNKNLAGKEARSLLYYHLSDNAGKIMPYALLGVLTTDVIDKEKIKDKYQDPIGVEAVWLSPNKKYINLSLKIKTSTPDNDDMRHRLGVVYEGVSDGVTDLYLMHDNGDIPGNYTVNMYFSIRVSSIVERNSGSRNVRLSAMTENGIKTFDVEI